MVGEQYGWATIAARTAASYAAARREHGPLQARRASARLAGAHARSAIPEGNLLAPRRPRRLLKPRSDYR